jgi:hypothetical protein
MPFFRNFLIDPWLEIQLFRLALPGGIIDQYKKGELLKEENKQNAIHTFSLESVEDNISENDFFLKILQSYFPNSSEMEISNAWSAGISVNADEKKRLNNLIDQATKDSPIYLTANTNSLDMNRLLLKLFPEELPSQTQINEKQENQKYIQIKENVFLCLSYKIASFETMQEVLNHSSDEDEIQIFLPANQDNLKNILNNQYSQKNLTFSNIDEIGESNRQLLRK